MHPRDGVPEVVTDPSGLAAVVAAFAAGNGPVAVDAERASGYRYGQRAYLVQLRRTGAGTALVDPVPLPDLSDLGEALADAEWVLHAANQDIPCLNEVGMRPPRIFDTELAGRLLDYPRVGLGPLVEAVLGLSLEKGHSAADWSTRPLPEPWLRYAALDVEVLVELRDALHAQLVESGKLEWALEEFAAIADAPPPEPRVEPWRRTSGLHRVRDRRRLAVVRALWEERDARARERDLSPGRVLPDSAVVEAALAGPTSVAELSALPVFRGRAQRREADRWFAAVERARQLPEAELPSVALRYDGPPPARSWPDRDPAAAARLAAARAAVTAVAAAHSVPVENLLAPETLRRVAWTPPTPVDDDSVAAALRERGARSWQVRLTAGPVAAAFRAAAG
ncbi:MAG TPA: HRDC domain-containing protein [Jiangellales bacterium]|nr:HRDC domain-containing protein [Jiangellales bacterium]